MTGCSTGSASEVCDPIIPAASIETSSPSDKDHKTEGVLNVIAISAMTLGGLNWLSAGIGKLAGARRANLVEGASDLIGVPALATFVYLLVGLAAAYYFILNFVMRIDGNGMYNDDKIYNWVFLGITAVVAIAGAYGMYA